MKSFEFEFEWNTIDHTHWQIKCITEIIYSVDRKQQLKSMYVGSAQRNRSEAVAIVVVIVVVVVVAVIIKTL